MRLHLPANHPHADTAEWTPIPGVTFTHGEAEITAANAAGLGHMLERFYGVAHGPKPEGGAVPAELPNVLAVPADAVERAAEGASGLVPAAAPAAPAPTATSPRSRARS